MIGIGFIGVGGMGTAQAGAFSQVRGCKVVAGSDLSPQSLKAFGEKFPKAQCFASYKDLLASPDVDGVVIAVPTLLHKDIAIDAMRAGKAVLIEKPMARTVADCRKMIAAAEKTKRVLMVGHCRRFDTYWGTLAKVIRSGKLGRPVIWRQMMAGTGPGSWFMDDKLGGGPMLDGAIHNHDFANYIFGEPDYVLAREIKLSKRSAVDTATAIVQYKSGDQLMLSWSWYNRGAGGQDVLGSKASLQFTPAGLPTPESEKGKYGYFCLTPVDGKPKLIKYPARNMYVTQAKHFLDCINKKAKCQSPPQDAIMAVAVGEAILKAARGRGMAKINI